MTRGQIWQKFPKLLRFMAPFPSLLSSQAGSKVHPEACARLHANFGELKFGEPTAPYSLEKAGTVDFKKHPARKVGTRSRQCRPKVPGRFAFPGARNPRICSISRSGKIFPAIFPGLSRSFPGEPPNRPRKQPQPSRVF